MSFFRHDLILSEEVNKAITAKSRLILRANELHETGQLEQAREVFAEAARHEEGVAALLREAGHNDDYLISLVSAASCWKKAGVQDRASTLFERALAGQISQTLRKKVVKLQEECSVVTRRLENNVPIRAARILLLLKYCSDEANGDAIITGLTRLAKLDFFLRYPKHLMTAIEAVVDTPELREQFIRRIPVEEATLMFNKLMTRHHFGPWDHNYYNVFAYLTSKGLISVSKSESTYVFRLEQAGYRAVSMLEQNRNFDGYVRLAQTLGEVFGDYLGSQLKQFIYDHFAAIANAKLGETLWES